MPGKVVDNDGQWGGVLKDGGASQGRMANLKPGPPLGLNQSERLAGLGSGCTFGISAPGPHHNPKDTYTKWIDQPKR